MGTYVKDEETSTLTLTDTGGDPIELSHTEGEVPEKLLLAGNSIDPYFPRDPDLGNKLNLDALAWDGSHLWLSGTNDEDICQLLKVDSDSEPDSLVSLFRIRSYKVYRRRFRGNLQSYPGRPFGTGVEKSGVS